MCKKLAFLAIIGTVGAAVLTQTKFGSYVLAGLGKAEEKINESIPTDWDLARIRSEVSRLDHDIEEAQSKLAKARVAAKALAGEVKQMGEKVRDNEAELTRFGNEIEAASEVKKVKWNGRELSVDAAKADLLFEVKRHKNLRDELGSKAKLLAIRERNRDLLEEQVRTLMRQQAELATAVTALEAEINLAKNEQLESQYQNDGSRTADIKKSIERLRTRVEVQRERLDIARKFDRKVDASGKTVQEILAEIKGNTATASAE